MPKYALHVSVQFRRFHNKYALHVPVQFRRYQKSTHSTCQYKFILVSCICLKEVRTTCASTGYMQYREERWGDISYTWQSSPCVALFFNFLLFANLFYSWIRDRFETHYIGVLAMGLLLVSVPNTMLFQYKEYISPASFFTKYHAIPIQGIYILC